MFENIREQVSRHVMLQFVLVSVVSWICLFVLWYILAIAVPKWVFLSDIFSPFWEKQALISITDFQEFVTANDLTLEEASNYSLIRNGEGNVALYPYRVHESTRDIKVQVVCSDGVLFPIVYTPSRIYWKRWRFWGLMIAMLLAESIVLVFVYNQIHRIKILYHQIIATHTEKRDLIIGVKGNDELSLLGKKVESMRIMLLKSIDEEVAMRQSQTELIASLSHDIRTPLTKISTCLDILKYEIVKTEEEKTACITMASNNAKQLKHLTDDLLNTVTSGKESTVHHREILDGASMLSQLLYEGSYALEMEGFEFQLLEKTSGSWKLDVDIVEVKRVMDNIFSNLQKYANKDFPIKMWIEESDEAVTVYIQNHKKLLRPDQQDVSHGIGLQSIWRILKEMGGELKTENKKDCFTMMFTLPKYNDTPEQE